MICHVEPVFRAAAGATALLHRACFPEDPWDAQAIEQIMSIPRFFGRIGWRGDLPAGFVLALDLGGEAEIVSLGVLPGNRRAGLGSALLDSICGEARLRRAKCLVLEVAADNDAARSLYTAKGFALIGTRPNYYRRAGRSVDALVLRLALAAAPVLS